MCAAASEANESLALAKQAEVELLRKEAERRAEMERDALRALAELRARQQAQQAAEEESARRLRDLEEEYQREVTSLRERLMQLEREVPPPPRADDLPDEYYCAITMELMTDPVIAADGFSYERAAIQDWLDKGKRTSPKTGALLSHDQLLPNLSLRSLIQDRMNAARR
mmetsp:Transcript_55913/g.147819  ORF Transcript_55913/g.147819 Transcript_55913/m.147819 type:complete len:169 (+) Transcript_55913:145-651(+)